MIHGALTAQEKALKIAQLMKQAEQNELFNRHLSYKPYEKQRIFHSLSAKHNQILLMGGNQLGKALKHGTPVLTPTGYRSIESLKVGDMVIAGDGSPTMVTGVYPQGIKPLHKLTFDQGEEIICCGEHLWKYQKPSARFKMKDSHGVSKPNKKYGEWTVANTEEIIKIGGCNPSPKQRVVMPYCGAAQLKAKQFPVDPYVVGLLLGDGCLRGIVSLTSADQEMVDAFALEADKFDCKLKKSGKYDYRATKKTGYGQNKFKEAIRSLGLMGSLAYDKRIPELYLINEVDVRLAVLQGLMDTDGSVSGGCMEFTSVSLGLADDMVFLVQSLGGKAKIEARIPTFPYKGEKKLGALAYRVRIRLPHFPCFRLERKLSKVIRPVSTTDYRVLHSIEPAMPGEATCISVEHEDHTFVIEHGIVTHNSYSGAYECMYHATGLYPKWWEGHRFPYPINIICGSVTFEMTMAGIQRNLLGKPTDKATWGTAAIPKSCIVSTQMSGQPKNFVSKIVVKHASGLGNSVINLTCYAKGREAWQADKADLVWFDEEAPYDVFDEGFTRLTVGSGPDYGFTGPEHRGFCYTTFTPLMGMSEVVRTFYPKPMSNNKAFVQLGIFDVNHMTDAEKKTKIMEYAPHLREARAYGIPVMGEGAIFNFDWEQIVIPAFTIPPHWYQINGIDFGIAHDSAGIKIAHDRDTDTIYVMQCHKEAGLNSSDFASRVRLWGGRWSWPHDGAAHEKGSGETLADQYKKHGLDMLPERATHDGKSNSLEASIMDVNERFQTGRLFIFENPGNAKLVDELRQYHRKQGKPVPIYDDAISAMRYAIMMVRFAVQDKAKLPLAKRIAALNGYRQSGNLGVNGSFMSN